jgi:ribosomal protein S17E
MRPNRIQTGLEELIWFNNRYPHYFKSDFLNQLNPCDCVVKKMSKKSTYKNRIKYYVCRGGRTEYQSNQPVFEGDSVG